MTPKILLIGARGYVGSAFAVELARRHYLWQAVSHTDWPAALQRGIELVINCAAFIPPQSVSLCDQNQEETIWANTLLPVRLAAACDRVGAVFAHISTGCLWNDGKEHSEEDPPQRAFNGHCGFYIGTKVLAERGVSQFEHHYIWRIRLPFDEVDSQRNYLSKLATMPEVWDHENTISHRRDFAKACLDLYLLSADFGTYNVMNPGSIRATKIVEMLLERGIRKEPPKITPGAQGGSIVSVQKTLSLGIPIRPVEEAVRSSLDQWTRL